MCLFQFACASTCTNLAPLGFLARVPRSSSSMSNEFCALAPVCSARGHRVQGDRGSGMGCAHSSALSNLAFYALVEAKTDMSSLGVLPFLRYRDDIFAVTRDEAAAQNLHSILVRQARVCWKVEMEDSSTYCIPTLDLVMYKGPCFKQSGHLDFRPNIKPTARHLLLSQHSFHNQAVHRSWP